MAPQGGAGDGGRGQMEKDGRGAELTGNIIPLDVNVVSAVINKPLRKE